MPDNTHETMNIDIRLSERLSSIESSIRVLDSRLPLSLPDRLTVLEQRMSGEISTFKRDLEETKKEAKLKMAERLVYIGIIITLITNAIYSK